jgi:hypothetical protein
MQLNLTAVIISGRATADGVYTLAIKAEDEAGNSMVNLSFFRGTWTAFHRQTAVSR